MDSILIVISFVLAGLRVIGVKHIAFQALAHCFVGGTLALWIDRRYWNEEVQLWRGLTIFLTVVEIICFIGDRL